MIPDPKKRNLTLALNLIALAVGMLMLAYASVPLYRLFCQVTGYGGTTAKATRKQNMTPSERSITVRFNAETDSKLPWEFKPGETSAQVHIGQERLTYYTARNLTDKAIAGHAVYNVVPHKAGVYFIKIECFCFTNQTLQPNQAVHMPVSFYLDPAMQEDPEMRDLKEITLSYTFFPAISEAK